MNVLDMVADVLRPTRAAAADPFVDLNDWASMFALGGMPLGLNLSMPYEREEVERNFAGYVAGAYRSNGVVFACAMTRFLLFSEARFQFQQMRGGQPGDLFGTPDLRILEAPWPGATTGDMLAQVDLDAQFAGTAILVRRPGRIVRLRPDWTSFVFGSTTRDDVDPWDPDADFLGAVYSPGGYASDEPPISFTMDELATYAPLPDPLSKVRGVSWVGAIIRDILGDSAAMRHKLGFFEHAATPQLVVKSDIRDVKKWREWIELFRQEHEGAGQAYRTLHIQPGVDVQAIGANLRQVDFKATMGHGESRIAAASGMHPVVVGLSEGLQGSSLNAGNFAAAARNVGNTKLRPMWRNLAGSLQAIVPALPGTRLWYDARDVPFLAEDIKDAAEVQSRQAQSIRTLSDGGYVPETVVDAVTSGDLRRLVHSGYVSVQMQPSTPSPDGEPPAAGATTFVHVPALAGTRHDRAIKRVGPVRAVQEFWPASGLLAGSGLVERDTVLEASAPHAELFPSLFEPADAAMESRARQLRRAGLTTAEIAGYLDRTERHVRRLLEPTSA